MSELLQVTTQCKSELMMRGGKSRCNGSVLRSPCWSFTFAIAVLASSLASTTIAASSSSTIFDVVKTLSQHQLLASFLEETELRSYVESSSISATLFAPTDNDFAALPTPYSFYLHSQWYLHLRILLSFHVVPQALTESQIFAQNKSLKTLVVNETITVIQSNRSINEGAATIVTADIKASNGYVQVTSSVLLPESLSNRVADYFNLLDESRFNYMLGVVKLAATNSGIGTALYVDNEPGVTLFVTPNSGFRGVSEEVLAVYFEERAAAYEITGYHAASILIYPQTFLRRPVAIVMMNGFTAWLHSDSDNTTKINESTVTSTTYATNGVVNEIDVLLRPLSTGGFLNLTTSVGAFSLLTFLESFDQAGLTEYFNVDPLSALTFFVPVDAAFTKVQTLITRLQQPMWRRHLQSLLQHHVTEGSLKTDELSTDTRSEAVRMYSNYTITVAVGADENISINDVPALISDLASTNGVIHIIGDVLLPPSVSESIYKQVSEFSTFNSLIKLVGLVDALDTSEGPLTLLAPSDEAFAKVGNLANYSNDEIHQILLNHVFDANIYASDIAKSKTTPNLISKAFKVTRSGSNTYVGGALILNADNLASNGVFHVIDHVLVGSVKATGASPKTDSIGSQQTSSASTTPCGLGLWVNLVVAGYLLTSLFRTL